MALNQNLKHSITNFLANIILIWLIILLYKNLSYYKNFLIPETQTTLFYLAFTYTIIGFFYYTFHQIEPTQQTKGMHLFNALKKLPNIYQINKEERTAILFILVKIFFLPVMLNFVFDNYSSLASFSGTIINLQSPFAVASLINILYPFALSLIFLIDTSFFAFSYAFEAKFLKNIVKSVEPTLIGWISALICYPPFNSFVSKHLSWYANDMVAFSTDTITLAIRAIIILLTIIFVGSTISLGAKCSNLTNRGIVSHGTYSLVRHPAYISKVAAWWLMIIPVFSIQAFLSMAFWTFIYSIRAITEENHLSKDPDYIEYKKKVKYRFIPYVF